MAVHNLEVTTEDLLSVVAQMPEKEFSRFIEDAKKLRLKPKKFRWTKDEIELIKQVYEYTPSAEKQKRFRELVQKRIDEEISEQELEELGILIDEGEELNVKRIEVLVKLAQSKNESLDEIMRRLEIRPPSAI